MVQIKFNEKAMREFDWVMNRWLLPIVIALLSINVTQLTVEGLFPPSPEDTWVFDLVKTRHAVYLPAGTLGFLVGRILFPSVYPPDR